MSVVLGGGWRGTRKSISTRLTSKWLQGAKEEETGKVQGKNERYISTIQGNSEQGSLLYSESGDEKNQQAAYAT